MAELPPRYDHETENLEYRTTMTHELDTRYDHKTIEPKIYALWEKSGYFNPDNLPATKSSKLKAKSFSIIMPPPNANGSLHIGHAVFVALQDILIRFWRMRGRKALWLPGADHAGFETQVVFDKKLDKEGRNRFAMPREEVYKKIWDFTQANKKTMEGQLRKLGASCDWSREKFTLDPDIVKGTQETFVKMYNDGLIYRDLRVINWCPKHKTALSDLEVKYTEREDPLYYIKYGPFTLATVRPETKFGDTALAVNPKDSRYKKYIGKVIEAQGVLGPVKFKVVADEAVDPKFGTGVVKVTPAHDATDFEIWQRHKNEIPGPKIVIDENGRLTAETGPFAGLKVTEAREKVAEKMKEIGILEKIDPHYKHQVATCYKCGTTLEPLPKPQWFVKMKPLAEKAVKAVEQKKIKFYPERSKKVYFHWLKNIRDWNISRQIVWGIRIPAWFCMGCGEVKMNPKIKSHWFIVRHGETDYNKEKRSIGQLDIPLNETGIEQARLAAQQLKNEGIDLIISSILKRARMTAGIIAKATGAEIIYEEGIRERHEGEAKGKLRSELSEAHHGIFEDYFSKAAGNESYEELEKRVWSALDNHLVKHHHKNIVFVTHGGVMRTLNKKIRNLDAKQAFRYWSRHGEVIRIDNLKNCRNCGGYFYEQDPDVFDTWFSSGQWPYLALGYPKSSDFKTFYPTDVMETAYDILFFWVARMIMFGLYRTGKIPFKTVYLHGLVRDKDRQKMSKSKGNVVDPLGVAELYGTDAVRMALVAGNTAGNDIIISEDKIRGYRNFATKIWNVSRFILMNKPAVQTNAEHTQNNAEKIPRRSASSPRKSALSFEDKKHLKELESIKKSVTKYLENFEFHLAAEKLYHYFWHTFADKIIESYKPRLKSADEKDKRAAYQTLQTILAECLKLLHPFMPFVTEEIYQKLNLGKLLMIEEW